VQELLAFPESFQKLEHVLKAGTPLLLKVRVQVEESGTRLSLQEARRLEDLPEPKAAREFRLRLQTESLSENVLDRLEQVLSNFPGANPVVFELQSPDGSVALLHSRQRVTIGPELIQSVRDICGEQAVAPAI
jgi:DNA polymerase III alpha subunit